MPNFYLICSKLTTPCNLTPNELEHTAVYKLLTGSVIPRPIGWISSISESGVNNLAPFSYFNAVGDDPPHVMFSTGRGNDTNKDTLNNVLATKQFVVNMVTEALTEQMNSTAQSPPITAPTSCSCSRCWRGSRRR